MMNPPMNETRDPLHQAEIAVGTSGYSFKDWVGPFYPPGTPANRFLPFYARHFEVVEINSTYYGIPRPEVFAGMAAQVPEGFGFYVKVHQDVTHKREDPETSLKHLYQAVQPLKDRGMLRGFLAQFPYSFKKNPPSREYIVRLADLWEKWEEPVFVEFRHISWFKPIVYQSLENHRLGFVNVDLPPLFRLPGKTAEVTNGIGYVRFHGRNTQTWWGERGDLRYDYEYSAGELREWIPRIRDIVKKAHRVVIFMNNCHLGQAPKNARMLKDLFADLSL
jgi:uncharacterized protein YecE (DUF72 family)